MSGTSAFNLILGPIEMGNAFNCILFGILLVQAYQYYSTFDDPRSLKLAVAFILLLDTVQTAVMIYMQWDFTITHYMDPAHLAIPGWAIGTIPFWSVPISWVVQGFYAWRIFQLTDRKLFIPCVLGVLSVIQGLAGFGSGIGAFMVKSIEDFPKLQPVAIIWFVGSILCDASITGIMVYILLRSRTGFRETDTLITKIIRSVVETGLTTTTIVIVDAIFFFRMPTTNMHLVVVMIAGKTYSNSMLYTLNVRNTIRTGAKRGSSTPQTFTTTDLVFKHPKIKRSAHIQGMVDSDTSASMVTTTRGGVGNERETRVVMEVDSLSARKVGKLDDEEAQYSLPHDAGDDRKPAYVSEQTTQAIPLQKLHRDE